MTSHRDGTKECPLTFQSAGHELLGILHLPKHMLQAGVIMIAAGGQYRVGPHRQHVLIARALAERGIPTLRYDSSGIADSGGPYRDFELGPDVDGAVDAMLARAPDLKHVVLWGICGSASALLMLQGVGAAVSGMILVNPWVRSEQSQARTYLKHYYLKRLTDAGVWRKMWSGRFDFGSALSSLLRTIKSATWLGRSVPANALPGASATRGYTPRDAARPMAERMADGLESFAGRVLLIMSGKDLTAREFDEFTQSSSRWRRLMESKAIERRDLRDADHTFSEPRWHDQLINWMADWATELARDSKA